MAPGVSATKSPRRLGLSSSSSIGFPHALRGRVRPGLQCPIFPGKCLGPLSELRIAQLRRRRTDRGAPAVHRRWDNPRASSTAEAHTSRTGSAQGRTCANLRCHFASTNSYHSTAKDVGVAWSCALAQWVLAVDSPHPGPRGVTRPTAPSVCVSVPPHSAFLPILANPHAPGAHWVLETAQHYPRDRRVFG